jgi:hypothetical protein
VNQAEDVLSLSHRKISNVKQRRDIRSHVMQRVRKKELSQGKKRPDGRNRSKQLTLDSLRVLSRQFNYSGQTKSTSSTSVATKQEQFLPGVLKIKHEKDVLHRNNSVSRHSQLSISPAVHELDPFQTLPSNGLPSKTLESLLRYCL